MGDVNQLFRVAYMQITPQANANQGTAEGIARVIGGPAVNTLLRVAGPTYCVLATNTCQALSFYIRSFAGIGDTAVLYMALAPQVLGKQRTEAITALQTEAALATGMPQGELAASSANASAVLRMVLPLVYGRLYNISPTAPYHAAWMLQLLANLLFMNLAPADRRFNKHSTPKRQTARARDA
jgi:hypothetical protein